MLPILPEILEILMLVLRNNVGNISPPYKSNIHVTPVLERRPNCAKATPNSTFTAK